MMEKLQVNKVLPPALGGLGGIIASDMVGDWVAADASLPEGVARWGRVISSAAVGLVGLLGLKGNEAMRSAGVAWAGASFGLALTDFFAQMGWIKQG